jgi:hypothetical protein
MRARSRASFTEILGASNLLSVAGLDWSSSGIDWRDATRDADMARGWLENERRWRNHDRAAKGVPAGYDLDLDARVQELAATDLDPERGWRLVLSLLSLAEDDRDVSVIGMGPLREFVRFHGHTFSDRIEKEEHSNAHFRRGLETATALWPGKRAPGP